MNLSANGKVLAASTKDLAARWEDTRSQWQDAKRREFEGKYLVELFSAVERAVPAFDQLEQVLRKVRCDCE